MAKSTFPVECLLCDHHIHDSNKVNDAKRFSVKRRSTTYWMNYRAISRTILFAHFVSIYSHWIRFHSTHKVIWDLVSASFSELLLSWIPLILADLYSYNPQWKYSTIVMSLVQPLCVCRRRYLHVELFSTYYYSCHIHHLSLAIDLHSVQTPQHLWHS